MATLSSESPIKFRIKGIILVNLTLAADALPIVYNNSTADNLLETEDVVLMLLNNSLIISSY